MNLKEAFRYQNRLQRLMDEATNILSREGNVTRVENTVLLHKVNPEVQDETTVAPYDSEYGNYATEVAVFLMYLLEERQKLSQAIRAAKQAMAMDFDGEISLNAKRQEIAGLFRRMGELRCSEQLCPRGGVGYKFNTDGNQVSYRCDLKKVTTINFDRNKIRSFTTFLSKKADQVSAELDKQMVNTEVCYNAPFDVNDTFAQVLQWHMEKSF